MARSSSSSPRRSRAGRPKVAPDAAVATLSVSLSQTLAAQTRKIAEQEHRKNSSVVAAALTLYTGLPHEVRRLVDTLQGTLSPEERNRLQRTLTGIALARDMEALSQEAATNLRTQGCVADALTEAELVDRANDAIRAVRAARREGSNRESRRRSA